MYGMINVSVVGCVYGSGFKGLGFEVIKGLSF
jgi:hypothetical protein